MFLVHWKNCFYIPLRFISCHCHNSPCCRTIFDVFGGCVIVLAMGDREVYPQTDRHHCFKSGNISKTEGGQTNSLTMTMTFDGHKKALLEQKCFTGSMSLLTTTTVLRYVVVLRISPLTHFFRNVVEKLALDGWNATSWDQFAVPLPNHLNPEGIPIPRLIWSSPT